MSAESSLGEERFFQKGDTIYRQGAESDGVYMIMEGQVEIWRQEGDDAYHVATIGEGELLGEVSAIKQQSHSVTAKSSADRTTTLFIEANAFRRSFSDPLVRHVVHTLAARLRNSYSVVQAIQAESEHQIQHFKSEYPSIEGLSRLVADKFLTYVELKDFPFGVGNISSKMQHSLVGPSSLKVPLPGIPELSDNHFEVLRRDGGYIVRDMGSQQGTIVNGKSISKYSASATAKLRPGKNEIICGRADSPVRFAITIPV
ncbi:cyclic nucleotide-binding domain-containing protein [Kordiimonas sp. SCSIO 12603]|uniref:cyclic nucleotide-binding domain-containing protein n=1 Tax=Kordiimonas sp. SCSIO 12603 TaxID=2829596 RepID=UPI002107EDF2|nr:cyclic nucleotide-binding domain-containing protein [Kordiimonas sp. SCSIO 12603]UTW57059.1 cyclic nucleotide-binding domain-containing protein [Kordiimonas sp. SCSIO 12603]